MTKKEINLTQFLSHHHLCASLTVTEVETLLNYLEFVEYKKDDVIANIGDVGEALYFVVKGEVALIHDDGSQTLEVGRMKEGELMGEMSFFDRKPRMLRVVATTDETQLLKLSRAMYQRLRVERPYVAVNLLEHAIISLDHLVRHVSEAEASLTRYIFGPGKR